MATTPIRIFRATPPRLISGPVVLGPDGVAPTLRVRRPEVVAPIKPKTWRAAWA